MLDWFEQELLSARSESRGVIITTHVYVGTRYSGEDLWESEATTEYFRILREYRDVVIIEVTGHDHFADLRYHSTSNLPGLEDLPEEANFHNMLVSPGFSTKKNQNPGLGAFEINDETLVPNNLSMTFLNVQKTIGTTGDVVEWFTMSPHDYGLRDLTADAFADFKDLLEDLDNQDNTLAYLSAKMGFDPKDPD